jgi:hypothetical protein
VMIVQLEFGILKMAHANKSYLFQGQFGQLLKIQLEI